MALSECKKLRLPNRLTDRVRNWFIYTWEQQKTLGKWTYCVFRRQLLVYDIEVRYDSRRFDRWVELHHSQVHWLHASFDGMYLISVYLDLSSIELTIAVIAICCRQHRDCLLILGRRCTACNACTHKSNYLLNELYEQMRWRTLLRSVLLKQR